ncbi:MAG: sterol desaturase family protein [Proteobacteria bacterium]|nr:sterol desaturase family protein [Pseudomonadota bacterium]
MGFHYTREPQLTQHALIGTLVAFAFGVGSTDAFAQLWSTTVASTHPRVLLVGGLLGIHTLVFWPVCFAFHWVDQTDSPRFIAKHRIQRERRKLPPLRRAIAVLVRNQFLFLPVLLLLLAEALAWRGWRPEAELPTLGRIVLELVGQAIIAVLIFYGGHRFLHRKWWMKRVHRVHHEFKATTAFASEYAHPVEFAIANFATLAGGALLLAPHLASMYLFTVLSVMTILVHHSGYALPWAPYSVPHDWHHFRVKELFGTTGMLDRLLGTDTELRGLEDGDEL